MTSTLKERIRLPPNSVGRLLIIILLVLGVIVGLVPRLMHHTGCLDEIMNWPSPIDASFVPGKSNMSLTLPAEVRAFVGKLDLCAPASPTTKMVCGHWGAGRDGCYSRISTPPNSIFLLSGARADAIPRRSGAQPLENHRRALGRIAQNGQRQRTPGRPRSRREPEASGKPTLMR